MATPPEYRQADDEREGLTLRDYLGVMWRRKWIIILVTVVATVAAFGFSYRQAKVYEAQADLIYEQQLDVANPLTGQTYTDPNARSLELSSVDAIIKSPQMTERAATELEEQGLPTTGFTVRSELAPTDATSGQTGNVVSIFATSEDPELAAAASQAYADSFVDWRKERMTHPDRRGHQGGRDGDEELLRRREEVRRLPHPRSSGSATCRSSRRPPPATSACSCRRRCPTAPISPKPLRSAILGFGVGLFAGIGLAFLLEQFDTRVRRTDDVAALLRQPVLARVPRLSREQMKSPHLVTLEHPADPVAESFRLLRTNLAFMDVDGTAKSLLVTSSLQGEGKSVTVANLAVTLALAGKKVIVVDADLRRPRQHKLFGLKNAVGASNIGAADADLVAMLQSVQVVSPDGDGSQADFTQLGVRRWRGDEAVGAHERSHPAQPR